MRALLLVAVLAAPQAVPLRWSPKEGDEIKYRTVGEFTTTIGTASLTAVNVYKVIRVDPDGSFLVQATPVAGEGKATLGGQEYPVRGVTVMTTYGPQGEIKEIRGDRADATGYRMANLTEFHAPNKPVAVGDSWSAEGKADPKTGAVAWKVDYKVVGEEQVDAFPALKMEVNARETDGTEPGKATGNVWVGKDGVLVKTDLTWANMTVPGAPGLVSGKLTRTRLP